MSNPVKYNPRLREPVPFPIAQVFNLPNLARILDRPLRLIEMAELLNCHGFASGMFHCELQDKTILRVTVTFEKVST
jgi:hypothetical protein